jgi:hypothetical protein
LKTKLKCTKYLDIGGQSRTGGGGGQPWSGGGGQPGSGRTDTGSQTGNLLFFSHFKLLTLDNLSI